MFVISCHSDTGFSSHRLQRPGGGIVRGHLDNFVGVHSVMKAYFSGRLSGEGVRIELTYGEERGCLGAMELLESLRPEDLVAVVDVTGTPTPRDFCIEKCQHPGVRAFLDQALAGMSYELYADCPDPVSDADETDIYIERCPRTFFLGIPVTGGDYNAGVVSCREASIDAVAEAICRIAEGWQKRQKQ